MTARTLVTMFVAGCLLPATVLLSQPVPRAGASPLSAGPAASAPTTAGAHDATVRLPVTAVDSVGMTVSNLDAAVDFYTRVLSFSRVSEREVSGRPYELLHGVFGARMRVATLQLGEERLELTEYLAPKGHPFPGDLRANDHAFQHIAIIVRDMEAAYAQLRTAGVVHASTGPQRLPDWNPNAGGIQAFYFRDPDGHFLEVLQFPPDKGPAAWHRKDRLFLGIDHTAIVVSQTERSLAFYRDQLSLRVAGESENYDVEQEHLNGVFGARLRITTLRAPAGPGIEFLEYLAPANGRPAPTDLASNDLLHWQTTVRTPTLEPLLRALRARTFHLVSPGPVALPADAPWPEAALVRDGDGHAIRMVTGR